jgi:hypothetical protein
LFKKVRLKGLDDIGRLVIVNKSLEDINGEVGGVLPVFII